MSKPHPVSEVDKLLSSLRKHISALCVVTVLWYKKKKKVRCRYGKECDPSVKNSSFSSSHTHIAAPRRAEECFLVDLFQLLTFYTCTDKVKRRWWVTEQSTSSYHGLYTLSGPMPAVLLHRHLHGRGGPHLVLRGHLRSRQLLGFLSPHRTSLDLHEPGVLDLLVSGKPRDEWRDTPQMRPPNRSLTTGRSET